MIITKRDLKKGGDYEITKIAKVNVPINRFTFTQLSQQKEIATLAERGIFNY